MIWGRGSKSREVKILTQTSCSLCNESVDTVNVRYDYSHIMWLFKGCKNEQYGIECNYCNSELPITRKEASILIGSDPIPLFHRYGGHILLLLVVGWLSLVFNFPCYVDPTSEACEASIEQHKNLKYD